MLYLVFVILGLALLAGFFGFTDLSSTFGEIAIIFLVAALVIFVITMLFRSRRR